MFKEKPYLILLFCLVVIIATGVLQFTNPDSAIFDGGLTIAVMLTVFLKSDLYTKLFGVGCFVILFLPVFYFQSNLGVFQIIMQHLFSGVIIIVVTLAVLHIKKLNNSIESDQNQTNALFEYATEGVILTNGKGEIILINPAALQLFQYEKEELIGKAVEILIPSRVHGAHTGYRSAFYGKPSNRTMGHGRDLKARKKNGDEFPVEVSLSYYKQRDQFFVIAFIVDITLRKQSEEELIRQKNQLEAIAADVSQLNAELENKVEERTMILKEALEQLEKSREELSEALSKEKELNEIKSRFVSMASHEFRTPLSTVLSSAALIGKYTKEEEQANRDKHIKRIKESVKHLNDLLEDFLSLGKLEEGKVKTEVVAFNLGPFMDDAAEEMKPVLKPGQAINVSTLGDELFFTDKRLLKNILINLLGNAIKFSPENSTVNVGVLNDGDILTVAISDKGIGISEEDQQHLFTSFFRARNAVNIQGTGLGLHIVKRYADLLNGTLALSSVIGEGTTITLTLPLLEREGA